jgi:beta-lactamase superfamily II metal-dependent hydrolase
LADTVGETAVLSVGENRYGHPSPEIMTILEHSGAEVLVTAEHGDVTLNLD